MFILRVSNTRSDSTDLACSAAEIEVIVAKKVKALIQVFESKMQKNNQCHTVGDRN